MKIALVHDWLYHMRGGEKVLESLAETFPDALIYTLFYDRTHLSPSLKSREIRATFLQYLPGIKHYYRWLLPLLPWIIQTLRIAPGTQLVISSSHCVAKGVRIPKGARHACYCHTPMRYLWGFEDEYFSGFPIWIKPLLKIILWVLRKWDLSTNRRIDLFIANSENVRKRIQQFYKRDAEVIYPPLDASLFQPHGTKKDYYLIVSAFVPYKKLDIVIEAFNDLDRRLEIIGSGPLEQKYKSLARTPHIRFLGSLSDEELKKRYAAARAVIFPTNEDFGIVPLEAQASGTPVIALGRGGALESVKTGVFFDSQTPESLRQAILTFETNCYNAQETSAKVQSFDKSKFKERIQQVIRSL